MRQGGLAQDPTLPSADHWVFGDEIRALAVNHTNQSEQADQRIEAILAGGIAAEAGLDHLSQGRIRRDAKRGHRIAQRRRQRATRGFGAF